MNLRRELEHGAFRVRLTDCGCGPDCDTRFLFATTHPQLWLALGHGTAAEMEPHADTFLLDAQVDVGIPLMVTQGVALLGQTWERLTGQLYRTQAQLAAFRHMPEWAMLLDVRMVWATRRVVFGDDETRVLAALECLNRAYVNEGPVLAHA